MFRSPMHPLFSWVALLAISFVVLGCARVTAQTTGVTTVEKAVILRPSEFVPVFIEDLSLGSQSSPVTLVVFIDLECPFCSKAWETVEQLRVQYESSRLRIVVKHLPLPFHSRAEVAARSVMAAQRQYGDVGAASHLRRILRNQSELDDAKLAIWQAELSPVADPHKPSVRLFSLSIDEQLTRDRVLATRLGIDGTPTFLVNGRALAGALSPAELAPIIDSEFAAAQQLIERGHSAGEIYAERVAANQPRRQDTSAQPDGDPTRWAIPVGDSPRLGPANAPVTIVAFMDYECPFCRAAHTTLKQLGEKYASQVSVVWKHRPLEFHEHARDASAFAAKVYRTKGNLAFWKVTDALFQNQASLTESTYSLIGASVGFDELTQAPSMRHGSTSRSPTPVGVEAILRSDADLADDFDVDGTPQFFINGYRLKGARSIEAFEAIVNRELANAEVLKTSGVADPNLGAELMKNAIPAPAPPSIAPAATLPEGPSMGSRDARVTVHAFSDYQCPFCRRADATIRELLAKYPKDVRLIWHDLPLSIHDRARAAATFAREVRAQRGDAAFFEASRFLFEAQSDLSEAILSNYAKTLGLAPESIAAAGRERAHGSAIDRDRKLAEDLHIDSTPTFVVGRSVIQGSQPLSRFERLVQQELARPSKLPSRPIDSAAGSKHP